MGRARFSQPFTPEQGLGPRFNENACNACHTDPADGGTGEQLVTKATRYVAGRCELLTELGGENVRVQATAQLRTRGHGRVPIPDGATHIGRFTVPFLFGAGLIDAIAVSELERLADPDDRNGDGISGRIGTDAVGRPARFGRKADVATLRDFVDGAFRLEMGLTTALQPDERRAGGIPEIPPDVDPAAEPEVDEVTMHLVIDFVRFLAPLARAVPFSAEDARGGTEGRTHVERGEALFTSLGCVGCHAPELATGVESTDALSGQRIALFSDLLLHDMGPALAGSCAAGASPSEYRTEPLMGLRYRESFLHDGRARQVIDAILAHGGEAESARAAFATLDRLAQESLIRYLATL